MADFLNSCAALTQRVRSLSERNRLPEGLIFVSATAATEIAGVAGWDRLRKVAKPLIVPSLLASVWRSNALPQSRIDTATIVLTALASTAGDVALVGRRSAKTEQEAERALVQGAGAFFLAHLSTMSMLLRHGARFRRAITIPRAVTASAVVGGLAFRRPHLALPVGVYVTSLLAMSALAADPALVPGDAGSQDSRRALESAGVVFVLSDALIGFAGVLSGHPRVKALVGVLVIDTYALAQLGLIDGLAALE